MKIIGIPSSQGSLGKNPGCANTPKELSKYFEIETIEIDNSNFEETNKKIQSLDGDLFIGGDHSITYPIFKSHPQEALLIFDAHPDCVNNFNPPTHEDFVRNLVEEKIISPEKILIVGLRNISPIEKEFLEKNKIKNINLLEEKNIEEIKREISNFLERKNYLSIDIDVLDEKFASGTGYPEKNGLTLNEFIEILKEIDFNKIKKIDFVEADVQADKTTLDSSCKILQTIIELNQK